jgi:hypothetical protein
MEKQDLCSVLINHGQSPPDRKHIEFDNVDLYNVMVADGYIYVPNKMCRYIEDVPDHARDMLIRELGLTDTFFAMNQMKTDREESGIVGEEEGEESLSQEHGIHYRYRVLNVWTRRPILQKWIDNHLLKHHGISLKTLLKVLVEREKLYERVLEWEEENKDGIDEEKEVIQKWKGKTIDEVIISLRENGVIDPKKIWPALSIGSFSHRDVRNIKKDGKDIVLYKYPPSAQEFDFFSFWTSLFRKIDHNTHIHSTTTSTKLYRTNILFKEYLSKYYEMRNKEYDEEAFPSNTSRMSKRVVYFMLIFVQHYRRYLKNVDIRVLLKRILVDWLKKDDDNVRKSKSPLYEFKVRRKGTVPLFERIENHILVHTQEIRYLVDLDRFVRVYILTLLGLHLIWKLPWIFENDISTYFS